MKTLLILWLFGWLTVANTSSVYTYKLSELRKSYAEATQNEEKGEEFHKFMSAYKDNDPVVLAYKAGSEAVMAKYVWSPYSKLQHLRASARIFNQAVTLDNDNPEIRFLRFTVEHSIPRYLNMSVNMAADKAVVIDNLKRHPKSGIDPAWARMMRDYLLEKDRCTDPEKAELRNLQI